MRATVEQRGWTLLADDAESDEPPDEPHEEER
jgi:hypothetical protein